MVGISTGVAAHFQDEETFNAKQRKRIISIYLKKLSIYLWQVNIEPHPEKNQWNI